LTDIFPRPFEIDLLKNKHFADHIRETVVPCLNSGSLAGLKMHAIQHVILPKKDAFDFRRCALIHPLDTIKYLALALTIADEIEKHRVPKSKHIVYSYRFAPLKNMLFDRRYVFDTFRHRVTTNVKRKAVNVLVRCDIANFYDRLNLHRLESTLSSLGIDHKIVRLINELLLFWANRDSYGLPIGSNASRILAEASLIEVDQYLLDHGVSFIRFVDDYRMFSKDAKSAHAWLTMLIERLSIEGLAINTSKTRIEDVATLTSVQTESDNS
jgi:hypothetical protein